MEEEGRRVYATKGARLLVAGGKATGRIPRQFVNSVRCSSSISNSTHFRRVFRALVRGPGCNDGTRRMQKAAPSLERRRGKEKERGEGEGGKAPPLSFLLPLPPLFSLPPFPSPSSPSSSCKGMRSHGDVEPHSRKFLRKLSLSLKSAGNIFSNNLVWNCNSEVVQRDCSKSIDFANSFRGKQKGREKERGRGGEGGRREGGGEREKGEKGEREREEREGGEREKRGKRRGEGERGKERGRGGRRERERERGELKLKVFSS